MSTKLQVIYEGALSDMPGRDESWIEFVQYLGHNQWEFRIIGTDFLGFETSDQTRQRMGTKPLIHLLMDSDSMDEEFGLENPTTPLEEDADDALKTLAFGPRIERLYEIAKEVGADYCVQCLDLWLVGKWPKAKSSSRHPKRPKLISILGVTKRGIWLGVYRIAYNVDTSLGRGYLSPPDDTGHASLELANLSAQSDRGWRIRLTKKQLGSIAQFDDDFRRISKQLSQPSAPNRL